MTDHRIARGPFDLEALRAPVKKEPPEIDGLRLLPFAEPPGEAATLYRALPAVIAGQRLATTVPALAVYLRSNPAGHPDPYVALAKGYLKLRSVDSSVNIARQLADKLPELSSAWSLLGTGLVFQGNHDAAVDALRRSIKLQPTADAYYNLGLAYFALDRHADALASLEQAVGMRFNLTLAWKYKARTHRALGDLEAARSALTRALELDPGDADLYREMGEVLRELQQPAAATRFEEHGRTVAR